ncbi:hypothetical protein B0T11DRAFT_49855 [Plectosphaerella cucumerina]|uniref:C2H2-type domain-containing protein n=1 Tax=Plectosphaerella cucumerina TaxID=40658 RepID=A0A8K0X4Q4_9PEZI|nr:hypothetical protein B0T11DRAFT_49855 [Plectosphaerella cucumerina]
MSANSSSWPAGDAASQASSSQPDHQEHLDKQMIQHLLSRYGQNGLSKLIRDEMAPQSDTASIISSAAQSSILSDDASSVWDAQSVRTFSSDSSSVAGSILSKGAKFLHRRSTSTSASGHVASGAYSKSPQHTESHEPERHASDAASIASGASKQKGTFSCGFCKEEDIVKTCTRKNDLKRHIEDFHMVNAQWFCRHRGCRMVFDWQAAYKTHLKTAHGGSRMSLDEAKVNLCPQVVFACGFEKCTQVYEAQGDDDSSSMFKDYVSHVVKHFDEGANSGEWTYSARIRNLLRQAHVGAAWQESSSWSENSRNELKWNTQTSYILRKRLESRHIGDVNMLVQYAYMLGAEPNTPLKFRDDFVTPVADTCQLSMPGHKNRLAAAAPVQAPADDFTFRISRGSNPALASYLASQRKVYVPSRQRVSRPAQLHRSSSIGSQQHLPHMQPQQPHSGHHSHQSSRSNLGHFFNNIPEGSMYHDPGAGHSQQYIPATSGMGHNGIIADDLHSLRSITSDGSDQADVDMQDTPGMMDFSSPPYSNYTLHAQQGYQ